MNRRPCFQLAGASALALLVALASCAKKEKNANVDITPEVQAFYKDTKNSKGEPFFRTKTAADVPADLKWEDGASQEEFGSPDAKKGGTFHTFLPDYPRTLRPIGQDANDASRSYIVDYFAMALLGRQPNTLEQIPAVAKQWAQAPDKKTFYFRIDPDARFSDGEKITADNFFFSFFYMRYKHNGAPWEQDFYDTKFENITKYDDLTLSITTAAAKPDAITYAGGVYPIPIAFHKHMGKNWTQEFNWKFVPSPGPYEIKPEGLKSGQSVTLTRIKDWWAKDKRFYRQLYNPDRIVIQVIRDPEKALDVFRTGGLDMFSLNRPERWYKSLPDNDPLVEKGYVDKVTFYNQVPSPSYGFYLNMTKPLLKDENIRIGLSYACNWDVVIKQIFYGDYERLNLMEEGFGQFTNPNIKALPFDVAKAAESFAKAGFTERGPDGIFKNASGQRLAFTITNTYRPLENALVVIKQEAQKAGLELNIETPEETSAWKKLNEKQHDIAFTAFNINVEMYPRFWEDWDGVNAFNKDGSIKKDTNNFTEFSDKQVDEWIAKYDADDSLSDMKDLAWKLEERTSAAAAFIPAFRMPWYRVAHWNWMKYPKDFDVRTAREFEETWAFWIDEPQQAATQEALKSGKTFPKEVQVFDKWRTKN